MPFCAKLFGKKECFMKNYYVPVRTKFILAHICAILWLLLSIGLSWAWLNDLAKVTNIYLSVFIICGICYIPGYTNAFLVVSLFFDKQPQIKNISLKRPITILMAAYNEENIIYNTLSYISNQNYLGKINIIVVDNASTDNTISEIKRARKDFNLVLRIMKEPKQGKFHALNKGLKTVKTKYVITLDADTLLLPSSVQYLITRIEQSPKEVAAVAGSMLVKNSRDSIWTKIQEWDYFLAIASIKRLQGLYQGTLVAQGAYSIYKSNLLKKNDGWPDAIGEDIVLTWRLLKKGYKVFYEPYAVAFTDAPITFKHFTKQRARWARGMIEGLKEVKPWQQPQQYTKYTTFINLVMPYVDFTYSFFWIPGLIMAFFGYYWIVGLMTLFVMPLTFISYNILYFYQKNTVFKNLNLNVRKNYFGLIAFILFYQMVMAPTSIYGYIEELVGSRRVWK